MNRKITAILFCVMALCLATESLYAAQTDKLSFKDKATDFSKSQFSAKLITATGAAALLPKGGKKGDQPTLNGETVTLSIGSAKFTGTGNDKNIVTGQFDAKLIGKGGSSLQVKAKGLNLVGLFPLQTADGSYTVAVSLTITAKSTSGTIVTLYNQIVTLNYKAKKGNITGKN